MRSAQTAKTKLSSERNLSHLRVRNFVVTSRERVRAVYEHPTIVRLAHWMAAITIVHAVRAPGWLAIGRMVGRSVAVALHVHVALHGERDCLCPF